MKISGLQENLKQGLFVVNHIANKNINLPILNNVLISALDGKIKLTSTNLEVGIVYVVRGKIEKEGSFTVDSKIISDYINLLPNKKVDVVLNEDVLGVDCENYKTKMKGLSAEEFPLIPVVERNDEYVVNADDFKKALSQVVFAASNSETRVELSGALFVFKGGEMIIAATDSYRLAEKKIKLQKGGKEEKKVIVPARTLQELGRILSGLSDGSLGEDADKLSFYLSENQILFVYGGMELVSRLIEGQYPDYEQIIPTQSKTKTIVEKGELVKAVKAASLFSKTGINDINLDFPAGKNKVVVSSASGQTGENITEIDSTVEGEDNGVVVNHRYLLDGLNNIDSQNVRVEIVDGNTPCVLRPEKEKDYLYIIMPIKQ